MAAEFSFLAVNRNSVESRARKGDVRAKGVLAGLKTLSTQLSSAQVGITVTNLMIGFLAEPAIASLIRPTLVTMQVPAQFVSGIAIVTGLVVATLVTMIFGELIPKNIAIARPYETAAVVQWPQLMFTRIMRLPIRLLNGNANHILGWMGVTPTEELASARSADELLSLVKRSADSGTLPRETAAMMERSLNFSELSAIDVMIPRLQLRALSKTASAEDVVNLSHSTGHSRFPVYGEGLDDIVGVVHLKQALRVARTQRDRVSVGEIMARALIVPASISLKVLLEELRADSLQMAIVVDEFGAVDGVVTIEDLLEELVGDLQDEHDVIGTRAQAVGKRSWDISGLLRPDELAEVTGIYLPEVEEVETIGGIVMHKMERIPVLEDSVQLSGVGRSGEPIRVEVKVLAMDGRRVDRLLVTDLDDDVEGEV